MNPKLSLLISVGEDTDRGPAGVGVLTDHLMLRQFPAVVGVLTDHLMLRQLGMHPTPSYSKIGSKYTLVCFQVFAKAESLLPLVASLFRLMGGQAQQFICGLSCTFLRGSK